MGWAKVLRITDNIMEEDDARIDTCCPVGARYDHSPSCWDRYMVPKNDTRRKKQILVVYVKMKCNPFILPGSKHPSFVLPSSCERRPPREARIESFNGDGIKRGVKASTT
jgi:hypothetical protein